jgi:hypothetical protein
MTLSPSVVQLFSMKPTQIIPPCTPPRSQTSDSGIESVKSKKQGRASHSTNPHQASNNFRGRGNSDPAVKKHNANNIKHFNKSEKQRASSLSPTKNLHTSSTSPKTAKKANYQKPTGTSKSLTFQAGRTPPRFGNGFKKQHSAPAGNGSKSSSHPTAIHTTPSSPTFRKKQQSSTAMKTKNNNHTHHSKNQDSDSGSASSGSNRSGAGRSNKSFVRTASLHTQSSSNNPAMPVSRQRNDNSFSNTIYRDEMWAGSAASPAATALPQPPMAWLKIKEEPKNEVDVAPMNMEKLLTPQKSSESRISARNATTTKSPLATSVQQMFASFNSPMVSTTA